MAVAAHARVRRQAGGVIGEPRVDDAGTELVAQVEGQVRQAHARGRAPARLARRSAEQQERSASFSGVAPQLERDGDRLAPSSCAQSSAATAVSTPPDIATSVRRGPASSCASALTAAPSARVQRVGREVRGVALAEAQPAERLGDRARSRSARRRGRSALDELDRGAGRGDRRSAAFGVEARAADDSARRPRASIRTTSPQALLPRGGGMRPGGHVSAAAREAQVVFEALVRHPAGV